jgi:hypothetical protein
MLNRYSWLQRPLAILAVIPLVLALPSQTVDLIALALLLAHYMSAFLFHPWGKIAKAGALTPHVALLILVALLSQLQFLLSAPNILLFFGLHFVLTELYDGRVAEDVWLRTARACFYGFAYLFFLRLNLGLEMFGPWFLGAALVSLAATLIRSPGLRARGFELAFLVPIAAAAFQPMRFSYVLLYHVVVWWMIPVVRGYSPAPRKYLAVTAVLSVVLLAVVLGTTLAHESLYWAWRRETIRLGYLHVALSFVMSSLNPWIIRTGSLRLQRVLANVVSFN